MRHAVLAAIILAAGPGAASTALACSCAAPATAEDALARASAVFSGEVTQVRRPRLERLGLGDSGAHAVTFRIIRAWKGVTAPEVTVRTHLTGEACGYPFRPGGSYLVFVRETLPGVETGICTGTRDLTDAAEQVRALDAAAR